MRKTLVTSEGAVKTSKQHKSPCSDCPFRKDSIPGWLGLYKPEEFIIMAHSDIRYDCHTLKVSGDEYHQCTGMAIFRGNICKAPRDKNILVLPANQKKVFAWDNEFLKHHNQVFNIKRDIRNYE